MTFRAGRLAEVSIAGTDLSAYSDSCDLGIDIDVLDTTTFGNTWKTAIAGLIGGSFSMGGNYDPTATVGPQAVLWGVILGLVPVAVVFKPGGTATGQRTNSFSALITSYSESSTPDDKVVWSADYQITGAVTPTTQ